MITPYFPKEAYTQAKAYQAAHSMPVFTWAMEPEEKTDCDNCGGGGIVYLRLAERGPFSTPATTRQPSTYFDGDGQFGKGWYVVKETMGFTCPKCKGIRK